MPLSHLLVLCATPLVSDYYSRYIPSTSTAYVLEKILKAFRYYFASSEIYVFLMINMTEFIGKFCVAHSSDDSQGFSFRYYLKNCSPKIFFLVNLPVQHRIVGVFVSRGEVSPFDFSAIFQHRLKANELISHAMPSLFWYYKATEHKVTGHCASRLRRCPAFINEADVHDNEYPSGRGREEDVQD